MFLDRHNSYLVSTSLNALSIRVFVINNMAFKHLAVSSMGEGGVAERGVRVRGTDRARGVYFLHAAQ